MSRAVVGVLLLLLTIGLAIAWGRAIARSREQLDDGLSPVLVVRRCRANDRMRGLAAGAEDEAQHWLGWSARDVARVQKASLAGWNGPGTAGGMPVPSGRNVVQFAVYAEGRYVGTLSIYRSSADPASPHNGPPGWQVGLFLVPEWRGKGLGTRLFRLGASYAHEKMKLRVISAGCAQDNTASARALAAAGFQPASGPDTHTLADGRVLTTIWFIHR